MQANIEKNTVELNWVDLLLECIELGISPEEVRSFLNGSRMKDLRRN
ncbi:anti-repressor SinI family protein [Bacillus sp. AFS041924]|nr:anti-repressor SinI family protein [Bacillus sp. AFS041924]